MNKKELIKQYTRQAKNLNHNIIFEREKPTFHEKTDLLIVEYMKGQLSIIREIIHYLKEEYQYLESARYLNYKLGEPI